MEANKRDNLFNTARGENLRNLRTTKELTIEEVAASTGIHSYMIKEMEEGKRYTGWEGICMSLLVYYLSN